MKKCSNIIGYFLRKYEKINLSYLPNEHVKNLNYKKHYTIISNILKTKYYTFQEKDTIFKHLILYLQLMSNKTIHEKTNMEQY